MEDLISSLLKICTLETSLTSGRRLTSKDDKAVVNRTLHHLLNLSDVLYDFINYSKGTYCFTIIDHAQTGLVHDRVKLLPRVTSISRSVNCSSFGLYEDNLICGAAPHDVSQWRIDLEDLETNFVCVDRLDYINHISCTSSCHQAENYRREDMIRKSPCCFILTIVSLICLHLNHGTKVMLKYSELIFY